MTKDEKVAVRLIAAAILLFIVMLLISLNSCAFRPLTIYVTNDTTIKK